MYPPMLKQAEAENHKAKRMFGYAVRAEEVHATLYRLALEAAKSGQGPAGHGRSTCVPCAATSSLARHLRHVQSVEPRPASSFDVSKSLSAMTLASGQWTTVRFFCTSPWSKCLADGGDRRQFPLRPASPPRQGMHVTTIT